MKRIALVGCLFSLALFASGLSAAAEDLSAEVLAAAEAVPDGGGYDTSWSGSGTPEAVVVDGFTVLPKGRGGSYCCGFTFAVATAVADGAGLLDGVPPEKLRTFQKMWYGAVSLDDAGDDAERAEIAGIRERQIQAAVAWLGIGVAVEPRDAQPGDLLQFWRGKSGHSVVFTGWVMGDGPEPVGLRYRSSQGSTDGVGDTEELFQGRGGAVDPKRMYFARLQAD